MYEYNGKKYARISSIAGSLTDFSQIPEYVLKRKQDIGTSVHLSISEDSQGLFPTPSVDALPYFKSYKRWAEDRRPSFQLSETRFFDDDLMITGQIDALLSFDKEKENILTDFKTSARPNLEVWSIQLHLYSYLIKQHNIPTSPIMLVLKLDKNLIKLPKEYEIFYSDSHMTKAKHLVDLYWKKNG